MSHPSRFPGAFPLSRLDRYCLRQITATFAMTIGIVAAVVLFHIMARALLMGNLLRVGGPMLAKMAALSLLGFSALLIPSGLLVSCVAVSARMRADGELAALQVAGATPWMVARSFLAAGLGSAALTLLATHVVEPAARRMLDRSLGEIAYRTFLHAEGCVQIGAGSATGTCARAPDGRTRLVVSGHRPDGADTVLVAWPSRIAFDAARSELDLDLTQVSSVVMGPGDLYQRTTAAALRTTVPAGFPAGNRRASLPSSQLSRRIDDRRARGLRFGRDRLELEKRFSFPAACLGFSILGLPLGYHRGRRHKTYGFLVGAVILLAYYVVVRAADTWADTCPTGAMLLLWAPNLSMMLVGMLWIGRRYRRS